MWLAAVLELDGWNEHAQSYIQLSDGPKSRSSFCSVSRRDPQYFTNRSAAPRRADVYSGGAAAALGRELGVLNPWEVVA
jgi:hypothetical protein